MFGLKRVVNEMNEIVGLLNVVIQRLDDQIEFVKVRDNKHKHEQIRWHKQQIKFLEEGDKIWKSPEERRIALDELAKETEKLGLYTAPEGTEFVETKKDREKTEEISDQA